MNFPQVINIVIFILILLHYTINSDQNDQLSIILRYWAENVQKVTTHNVKFLSLRTSSSNVFHRSVAEKVWTPVTCPTTTLCRWRKSSCTTICGKATLAIERLQYSSLCPSLSGLCGRTTLVPTEKIKLPDSIKGVSGVLPSGYSYYSKLDGNTTHLAFQPWCSVGAVTVVSSLHTVDFVEFNIPNSGNEKWIVN